MALTIVTAPSPEPVSLAEAKAHCRVDVSDEDTLITSLIQAAREYAETFTHRALITQTWDLKLDEFPDDSDEPIWLPKPPVASVTSVTYLDTLGVSQTWALTTGYITDLPSGPWASRARITPAYGVVYPSTYDVINSVTVRFVAGYGAAGTNVPASILAAIKLMVGHWYENRAPVNIGNLVTRIPDTVDALLWPYKAF